MVAYQGGVHIGGAGIVIVLLCVTNVMDGRLFYVYKIIFSGYEVEVHAHATHMNELGRHCMRAWTGETSQTSQIDP